MVALPKVLNAGLRLDNFRSILLASFVSKINHGLLRKRLLPNFCEYRFTMQLGGIPQLGTDCLHLYVQSFAQYCHQENLSHAALFVDIRQAFYRACRPLIAYRSISLERVAQLFSFNAWSPQMFHDFLQQLHQPDALQQAKVSSHHRAQVTSALTSTWFRMRDQPQTLTSTDSGVKPGDAIADILFGFLMTRYLGQLRSQFVQFGLRTSLELKWIPAGYVHPGETPPQNLIQGCWVDDLVLLLQDTQPPALIHKLTQAVQLTQEVAVSFALQLNFGSNKTAAVIKLRGPHSRDIWKGLMDEGKIGRAHV